MTVPLGQIPTSASAPDVQAFVRLFALTDQPEFLIFQEAGYSPDWCHVTAKHHALSHGGRRIHGWALWQYQGMVMGDFHSVWDDGGQLVDMTPPKFGANQVLFVRDRSAEIYKMNGVFALPTNRSSLATAPFWWEGKPTNEQVWGMQDSNPALLEYCGRLGFLVDSLVTELGAG